LFAPLEVSLVEGRLSLADLALELLIALDLGRYFLAVAMTSVAAEFISLRGDAEGIGVAISFIVSACCKTAFFILDGEVKSSDSGTHRFCESEKP
jgi:hypothetical protein